MRDSVRSDLTVRVYARMKRCWIPIARPAPGTISISAEKTDNRLNFIY